MQLLPYDRNFWEGNKGEIPNPIDAGVEPLD